MIANRLTLAIGAATFATGFLIAWNWQSNSYESEIADIRRTYSEASTQALTDALEEQQRRITATKEISNEGDAAIKAVDVATDRADESIRLRNEQLTSVLASTKRDLSNAATQRATDRQTIMVLSELYRRADDRADELAGLYEGARTRGLTCEAAYAAMCGAE